MTKLSKFGALALLEKLNTIISNQEKTMSAIDDLRAAHTALSTKVAELTTTTSAALTAVAADVTYLRNQIAAGTVTPEDVAKATGAVASLQTIIDSMKSFDAVPEFPAPPA